jgi:hypothetical protein
MGPQDFFRVMAVRQFLFESGHGGIPFGTAQKMLFRLARPI